MGSRKWNRDTEAWRLEDERRAAWRRRRAEQRDHRIVPEPTLEDLPAHGVTEIRVWCAGWPHTCTHNGTLRVADLDLTQTISQVCRRLVCTRCGLIGGSAQPNWPR